MHVHLDIEIRITCIITLIHTELRDQANKRINRQTKTNRATENQNHAENPAVFCIKSSA